MQPPPPTHTLPLPACSEGENSTEAVPLVDIILNMKERKTGGLGCGGGLSAGAAGEGGFPGIIGSFTYNERNLFGLNQRLSASAEIGQIDKLFRIQYTDPWVNSDSHRTSRTIQLLNNRTLGTCMGASGILSMQLLQGNVSVGVGGSGLWG